MNKVVVITPTVGRTECLLRNIYSVKNQDFRGGITQIVVGDHLDSESAEKLQAMCNKEKVSFLNDLRPSDTAYPPARTGRIRNLGISSSIESFVTFLDDDNTIDEKHIFSLVSVLEGSEVEIAYSWRRMLKRDGTPCRLRRYPWVIPSNERISKEVFKKLEDEGIFEENSSIIRDRVPARDGDLFHIDSSEWMMKRSVFDSVRFIETATPRQMIYQNTEDYLFCKAAFEAGMRFKCTEQVTLNYYVGGYHAGTNTDLLEK